MCRVTIVQNLLIRPLVKVYSLFFPHSTFLRWFCYRLSQHFYIRQVLHFKVGSHMFFLCFSFFVYLFLYFYLSFFWGSLGSASRFVRCFLLLIQLSVKGDNAELEPIDSWLITQGMVRTSPVALSPPQCPPASIHHVIPTPSPPLNKPIPYSKRESQLTHPN